MRILGIKNWKKIALNRDEWARLLKKARAHQGLSSQWWWWWYSCNFKKGGGKKEKNIVKMCARLFLVGMKVQWDKGGRRILLGDNTGGHTAANRCQCVGVWISTELPSVYNIHNQPYAYPIQTCAKCDLHGRSTTLPTASVWECL